MTFHERLYRENLKYVEVFKKVRMGIFTRIHCSREQVALVGTSYAIMAHYLPSNEQFEEKLCSVAV